jgi:hypothetical protein
LSYSSTLTACIILLLRVFDALDKVISVAVKPFKTMQAPIALDRSETVVVPSGSYMVILKELDMSKWSSSLCAARSSAGELGIILMPNSEGLLVLPICTASTARCQQTKFFSRLALDNAFRFAMEAN